MRKRKPRIKKKQQRPILPKDLIYIALHKPYDCLSQFTSQHDHQTLSKFGLPNGVYAAGRLDRDSEGLLLLSNDGPFINMLLHPNSKREKTYWAQVEGCPKPEELQKLMGGLKIQDYTTKPCQARVLSPQPTLPAREPPIRTRKSIPTTWIEITLTEGKNRQVRRMTAKIGFPTLRLIRKRIAKLDLGELKAGQWRYISKTDIL